MKKIKDIPIIAEPSTINDKQTNSIAPEKVPSVPQHSKLYNWFAKLWHYIICVFRWIVTIFCLLGAVIGLAMFVTTPTTEELSEMGLAMSITFGSLALIINIAPIKRATDDKDDFDEVVDIDGMEGHTFEHFCAKLLRQNGFSHVNVTQGSGDQGVDILARKGGRKYAIQCKNYSRNVGNFAVQAVFAGKAFYHCDVAVVLTNSYFTPSAISLAHSIDVELWDRKILQKMMKKY